MEPSTEFGYRFYNAGRRISELIRFSTSDNAPGQSEHGDGISFWPFEAPEKSWFFVPSEIEAGPGTVIRVTFKDDIRAKWGHMGVVMLDPRHKAANEDPEKPTVSLAATEEAVVARAEELWNSYTLSVIERHLADCDQAQAAGGRPRKASGFTKFCFKLHGKVDPGDTFAHTANVEKPNNDGLMGALALALIAMSKGEKVDATLLENLVKPGTSGAPVTSGIATGKVTKPITGNDGWDKQSSAPRNKGARANEAASAL